MRMWNDFGHFERVTADLPRVQLLETMATFSCTLACRSCTNYSDYGMKGGYVRWSQMQDWLDVLFTRLRVDCFSIIGGEPFLNPELQTWVDSFRERYPYITLMLLSNATLLEKNWWILDSMEKHGMIYLKLTNHQPSATYFESAKQKILERFTWRYEGDNQWFEPNKILDFRVESPDTFLRTFRGEYANMKPYDSDPAAAFKICNQQICPLLVDGKLYKCSSVGMLNRALRDHGLSADQDWSPYKDSGIALDCDDATLRAWAANIGKPHRVCRMCPTSNDRPFHNHFDSVVSRI